ncbi:MAG: CCA tRNA nucleotidyltransferase [Acidobacteria bacterium]|nr:CCA tRNA nucleotidyltransferase [Acidobacteriota bacterium]MBI3661956.1 CCA tRNA nucleotidyltransferase [Acidobacteriota bacterium]
MHSRALADKICASLHAAGHQAWFVGGCVRDLMLGRDSADFDISTDATPPRVLELFPGSIAVGAKFGVILVVEDGAKVEVATFRSDMGYSDGRHPDRVVYSQTPQEDVLRRDFTINGLLMDPRSGEVLDFVGGRADIDAKIIRAIGEPALRFAEDKLRMVRAVRFAARLGYALEPATFAAIQRLAPEVTVVSAERLRDELTKLLTEGAASRGFELLDEAGLLPVLLPDVAKMKGVEQPPQFHPEGDVWIHTRMMLEMLSPGCSPTLAWGVLLHDVGKPPTFAPPSGPDGRIRFDGHVEVGMRMAEEICRELRFSNEDAAQIVALVEHHLRFKDVPQMRASTLKRFVRLPRFEEHLELHRLDCLSSHRMMDNYDFVRRFLAETPSEQVRPPRLITGDDLKHLGLEPGPQFRSLLRAVEDAQLEGRLTSREGALDYVRAKLAGSAGN